MVTWSSAVEEYLSREGRRLAPATVTSYKSTLEQATKMLKDKPVSRTTRDDLEDILWGESNSFLARGLKPNVINVRRGQIVTFIKWCLAKRYIKNDVTYKLPTLPAQKVVRRRLGAELLLDALDAAPTPRDRIMLALGTFTGSRISEVKLFQLQAVDLANNELSGVIPKTRKVYRAKMAPELRQEMNVWLAHYAKDRGFISPQALLTHVRQKNLGWYLVPRMTRPMLGGYRSVDTSQRTLIPEEPIENVYHMMRKIMITLGLEDAKGEGFHTLRRSAARHIYDQAIKRVETKDQAMRMTQLYLNHSSMAVTEKYVGLSVERAILDDFLDSTPMLGGAYEARYGRSGLPEADVIPLRREDTA